MNKGQARKLEALRKSLGDKIADKAFGDWMAQQAKTEPVKSVDHNAKLIAQGFDLSVRWKLQKDSSLRRIGELPEQPGVYAIVVDGVVKYVGCTQKGLAQRVRVYEKIPRLKSKFSVRHKAWIIQALKNGSEITVLTLVPPKPTIQWKGLPVDLIAGLEKGLINEIQPEFTQR